MQYNNKTVKMLSSMFAIVVALSILGTSYAAYGSGLRLYIPFLINVAVVSPPPMPVSKDLRIDNIALGSLDTELYNIGILDAAIRSQLISGETARRNGTGGAGVEGYPAPEAEPEQLNIWPVGCLQGQACAVAWKGAGTMRSHFAENKFGWTAWSAGVVCPPDATCTVVSSIGGDQNPSLANRRQWVYIQVGTIGFARFLERKCWFQ